MVMSRKFQRIEPRTDLQKLMDAVKLRAESIARKMGWPPRRLFRETQSLQAAADSTPTSVEERRFASAARSPGTGLDLAAVKTAIVKATDQRSLGIFGEPGVNVLKLNLALDGAN